MLQPSEEIKSKLDIVEIIREYIPLKPAGINFRALCPFHREKTPSFMISPEKQIWHCFGCSKGGDVFTFLMEIEGISFVEALRMLAPKAGVQLKRQNPALTSQRNRLLDILEICSNYYHETLISNKVASRAKQYLNERGVKEETINEWQIGYSPDSWDDVINLLFKKGFKENEIFLAGMSIKKEGTSRFYNRFRDRIMFPINDSSGSVVAFSARVNPEKEEIEKMGKYINSPQTMIYDKSRIIFGLDKAKIAVKTEDLAILVEGQMDVITAHQQGFKNVIAASGTALTEGQIKLIKRYTNNIILAFDQDRAGELAADRGIREAMRAEMNIKVITLPEGKDPDELIKNSPEKWQNAVEKAQPMMEYYFQKELQVLNLDKIEDRRKATMKLLPVIASLGNIIERDYWVKKLSQTIDVPENLLRETLNKALVKKVENLGVNQEPIEGKKISLDRGTRTELLSEILLALIIKYPNLIDYVLNNIFNDQIGGQVNKSFYKSLIFYYNYIKDSSNDEIGGSEVKNIEVNYQGFKLWLENKNNTNQLETEKNIKELDNVVSNQLKLLDRLVLLGDKDFYDYQPEQAKAEL
ncbi:MAG: DNA primase, partial [Patescibacteria group bacterium]